MSFIDNLKKRRSIYSLGKDINLSEEEVVNLVKDVVKVSPTAFNSQSQRVVILFDDAHEKLWKIVEEVLKPLTPEENFSATQAKMQNFANGKGTILFFEDQSVVENLQDKFPLYTDAFPIYSQNSTGIAQGNVWTALANEAIGANLQHYNPVIDEKVAEEWDVPKSWSLRAQLVFGSIEQGPKEKTYISDEGRFLVYK